MPGGDRTGPAGMGPMTGRGMGYCAGYNAPGYVYGAGGFYGRGGGRGFGRGRGYRNMYYLTGLPAWARYGYPGYGVPQVTAEDERAMLRDEKKILEEQLKQISQQLNSLEEQDNENGE